jgi:hypothetical protein
MKVKKLIEKLSELNPNLDVFHLDNGICYSIKEIFEAYGEKDFWGHLIDTPDKQDANGKRNKKICLLLD